MVLESMERGERTSRTPPATHPPACGDAERGEAFPASCGLSHAGNARKEGLEAAGSCGDNRTEQRLSGRGLRCC